MSPSGIGGSPTKRRKHRRLQSAVEERVSVLWGSLAASMMPGRCLANALLTIDSKHLYAL